MVPSASSDREEEEAKEQKKTIYRALMDIFRVNSLRKKVIRSLKFEVITMRKRARTKSRGEEEDVQKEQEQDQEEEEEEGE